MKINSINQNNGFAGRPMVIANYKMNLTPAQTAALVCDVECDLQNEPVLPYVGVAPTALAFMYGVKQSNKVHVGAQEAQIPNVKGGAMTGGISQDMFAAEGADFVIIGHSERRTHFAETDTNVNEKVHYALKKGLTPIVCVGENLHQKEDGLTGFTVSHQVQMALSGVDPDDFTKIVFAYEPLWAINTGVSCEPDDANRVCGFIRDIAAEMSDRKTAREMSVLYGGSVNDSNAGSFFVRKNIDGALVGGASLDSERFYRIIKSLKNSRFEDVLGYSD